MFTHFFAQHDAAALLLVALAGLYAGTQNVLAGGGSFITFPALLLAGLNPLAANITSTVALFPNQLTSSFAGRHLAGGVHGVSLKRLFILSIVGGIAGAVLLLCTPVSIFSRLVPWLVLFATTVFAWGNFRKKSEQAGKALSDSTIQCAQFLIGVYGGYFGGGIGFLMLAVLTIAGQQVRMAAATKNMLAMAMNASAVAIFAFSDHIDWVACIALMIGGVGGAFTGNWLMHRLPEKILRGFIVAVGVVLTIWLFVR
ncbi:MAG TPA: sulfite exporter TauE/SafE family protein [Limnobacter sp.]|uniref:sulfite exporter TauE/SafE family protein n=1 Tax=Limnobacter sp. TaxID=2003368 RepID=UPI002ED77987